MKTSIEWLLSYTDIDKNIDPKKLASDMTISGSKVETVETIGGDIKRVVVGKCIEVKPHQDSDHLQICQVDVGGEVLQIVTGAPNIREGAHTAVALDNSVIADGKKIKSGKLRGVESCGMMCSFDELGLNGDDFEGLNEYGVIILENMKMFEGVDLSTLIGKDIMPVLGASETIIDFEITSNRADCFSVLGLSLEAAVTERANFSKPEITVKEEAEEKAEDLISVEIEAPDLCPRYMARVVKDVKIAPSPKWMRDRLASAGVRAINNIVDITNYVMLEYGQPMHAFDKKTIHENKIIVRRAADGEKMVTLDEQERTLDSSMLVIADCNGPVALAGVMGGLNSEIEGDTDAIVFEAAIFDGVTVRRGAKKVGLRTEASSRFEKGLDTINCAEALERAVQLVEELGAGKVCKGVVDCYPVKKEERHVEYDYERVNKFIGIDATEEEQKDILERLRCKVCKGYVIPPSFRGDLLCDADIAEEVARFYGYNNIKSSLLSVCETTQGGRNRKQLISNRIRENLKGAGYDEMLSFSFLSPSVFDQMCLPADDKLRDAVVISNPLGEDFSIMRTSMIPSVLDVLAFNQAHRNQNVKIYEIAYTYLKTSEDADILPEHKNVLAMGSYGNTDFYTFKGEIEDMLAEFKITNYEFEPVKDLPYMHPGRTAALVIGGKEVGILGQIHPAVADKYECPENTFVAEIAMKGILDNAVDIPKQKELPKYPAVTRDIAVVLDKEVPAGHVEKLIRQRGGKSLEKCELFDCYEGVQVGLSKKSLAYALSFRSMEKTMTDEDVNKIMKKILNGLETEFGAELRS